MKEEKEMQNREMLSLVLSFIVLAIFGAVLAVIMLYALFEIHFVLGYIGIGCIATFFVWGIYEMFIKKPKK